jgi:integrase
MLEDFINQNPYIADPSKALLRQCFHALFNFAQVEPNPAKGLPRWRETPRRVLVPDEGAVRLALETAVSMTESSHPAQVRDGLIFALAVVSGNRRGELRNLPINDLASAMLDPQKTAQGTVYRVYTHGKEGEACCRFTAFHLPLISRYLAVRPATHDPHVFVNLNPSSPRYGRQLSLVAFDRVRPKVCKLAGVGIITYQELRRRLATSIARSEGVDVAAHILNHSPHSGDRVIRAYYYDPDKAAADKAAAKAFGGVL